MVTNLSKTFLKTQMLFVLAKTGSRERKLLNLKTPSKTFTQDYKPISNYIYPL